MNDEAIIFIVGVGRSGTTLLQSMLNAHKDIAFTPETHFIRLFLADPRINRLMKRGKFRRVGAELAGNESLQRLDLDIDDILSSISSDGSFRLLDFYKKILDLYRQKKQKTYIGDKDPKNVEYLRYIKESFPRARVIQVIRDPRDLILSRIKAEWSKGRPFLSHLVAYREQLRKGSKDGRTYFGKNYYELRYENLITDPRKELFNISRFLGVDYDPEMLNFPQTAAEIIKGDEIRWKESCFKPVMSDNMNKWAGELTRRQVSRIEKICRQAFRLYDYRPSGYLPQRSIPDKMFDQLLGLAFYGIDLAYTLYHRIRYVKNRLYGERRSGE